MAKLEECVRSVQVDGLLWGTSKLVPVGYGIKKLQIACVVEDDKVGTDLLEEEITKFEDYVSRTRLLVWSKQNNVGKTSLVRSNIGFPSVSGPERRCSRLQQDLTLASFSAVLPVFSARRVNG